MNSNTFLKLCAVASSLLLVVAFVSYRAGALEWLTASRNAPTEVPAAPDESGGTIELTPIGSGSREHLLYSSKSGAVFIEPQQVSPESAPVAAEPTVDPPVLFSGSKSLQMLPATAPSTNVVDAKSETP